MKQLVISVLISSALALSNSAVTLAFDQQFYSSNDIYYYDPDAAYCDNVTESTTATPSVPVSDNLETLLRYFTGKGFSLAAAAGIAGNIMQESGFNPAIIQGGANATASTNIMTLKFSNGEHRGFGLAQWTDAGRKQNLVNFAKKQGKSIINLNMQLDFMWQEMSASGYSYMITRLNTNTNDPVAAAAVFHGLTPNIEAEGSAINPRFAASGAKLGYERSGDSSNEVIQNRGGASASFYASYQDTITDGTGVTIATDTGDTSIEAYNPSLGSCDSGQSTNDTRSIGVGEGNFTDNGEVAGWATVRKNSLAVDRIFGSALEGDGWCASIVSRTWRGQDIGYGVNYARTLWYVNQDNGIGHADRSPKKGAILIYDSNNQPAGHVVIYLGDNKVLNDGKVRDASYLEEGGWGLLYLGWIDPNDLGWTTKEATDTYIRTVMGRFDE